MPRLTPQQVIDREMEKLKAMGVTMSVNLSPNGDDPRVASVLKDAAKDHGLHYGDPDDSEPRFAVGQMVEINTPGESEHGTIHPIERQVTTNRYVIEVRKGLHWEYRHSELKAVATSMGSGADG